MGDFRNGGGESQPAGEPEEVRVHDFKDTTRFRQPENQTTRDCLFCLESITSSRCAAGATRASLA